MGPRRSSLTLLIATGLLVGCNYRKSTEAPPPVTVPATFAEGGEPPPPTQSEPKPVRDARWWRSMQDPTLSALIEEALRRNPTVREGSARVRQSKHIADQVRAARMPQVALDGGFTAGRDLLAFGEVRSQQATGSTPVSYEVDLFARRAREHQGAQLDAEAARLDQEALAISISAEVAEAWFDAINARIEVAVVEEQLETDLRFLELVELRYREGLNSAVDVHQQRQRVASQRALLALSEAEIDLTDQRLSILLGEAPGRQFPIEGKALPVIGPTPEVDVPAVLLEARPDIRAAYKRVHAEDRRVASAIGATLPVVTLDFTPSYNWLRASITTDAGGELDSPTSIAKGFTWNAGAGFSVPLFDGLRGVSEVRSQRAVLDQLVQQYADAILSGLFEVESALVLERQERLRIEYLQDDFRLAGVTLDATQDRYRAGLSDFLPVLTALQTRQLSELQLVSSKRRLVSYRVQLYRALGGAWPDEFGEAYAVADDPPLPGLMERQLPAANTGVER